MMPKWEYKVVRFNEESQLSNDYFNTHGNDGWELAAIGSVNMLKCAIFKRKKSE
ncbi:MAG: DUF4177 domain-containing protein [Parcubacteria group bacterium]|nr:DUF4177 domain-containing protein [Parcubacteria group bacterium]